MSTFAQELRALRTERGLTQEQLAQALNVSRTTISRWESSKALPDIETIKRLNQVLNHNFFADVERAAEPTPPAETSSPAEPAPPEKKPRRKWGVIAAVLALVLILAGGAAAISRMHAAPTQASQACPLVIFAVNESVTPVVDEARGPEPAFIYRFSVQNVSGDTSFTIRKVIIDLDYMDGSAAFHGEYDQQRVAAVFGTSEFAPGYGSLWMGAETADKPYSGVTMRIEGVDSHGCAHTVSNHVRFERPAEQMAEPAHIVVTTSEEVAYLAPFPPDSNKTGYGWEVIFFFENRSDVPFQIEKLVYDFFEDDVVRFHGEIPFEDIRPHMSNDKLLRINDPLKWPFGTNQLYLTSMKCTICGTDDNGNYIEASASVRYSKEYAPAAE